MAKQSFTTGQVLTADQMTSLQQTAMLGGSASAKVASYVLVAADAGTSITMSNASATTITVNTALFAAGDTVQITNLGAGVCTITAGTATVNTASSLALAQYESGSLIFTSTSAAIYVKGAGAAATSGGMTLLSTTSLSGATTTISSINQTYTNLYAVIYGMTNATADGAFRIAINADTTSAYLVSLAFPQGGSATIAGSAAGYLLTPTNLSRTDSVNTFALTFPNYATTSVYRTFNMFGRYTTAAAKTAINISGSWDVAAITSLVFSNSGGNMSTGTVLLYGVK